MITLEQKLMKEGKEKKGTIGQDERWFQKVKGWKNKKGEEQE